MMIDLSWGTDPREAFIHRSRVNTTEGIIEDCFRDPREPALWLM